MDKASPPFSPIDALFLRMILDLIASGQGLATAINIMKIHSSLPDEPRKSIENALDRASDRQQAVLETAKQMLELLEPKS